MKKGTIYFGIICAVALMGLVGCKKKASSGSGSTAGSETPYFNTGHGLRRLQVVTEGDDGTMHDFITADVSLSDANTLHWCYGITSTYGENSIYRRTMNALTGDSMAELGNVTKIKAGSLNTAEIRYAPYTNKLYCFIKALTGTYIDGDIQYRGVPDNLDFFHPYASGDLATSYKGAYYENGPVVNADITSYIKHNGQTTGATQQILHAVPNAAQYEHLQYRVGQCEEGPDGNMVAIVASADSIVAIRLSDGERLASVTYTAFSQTAARTGFPYRGIRSRRSQDGATMTCLFMTINIASDLPTVTTVRYNFATHELNVVLPGIQPAGFQNSMIEYVDFDEDGALYFPANVDPVKTLGLKIIKQTAGAQSVLATGFINDDAYANIQFLKVINKKVYIALSGLGSTPGKTTNSRSHMLGVIE